MDKVNLSEKLEQVSEQWKPRIVGELNGQLVKLVKFQGPFVWHHHDREDELFLFVKVRFRMECRDRHVWLEAGAFPIVPRGVEHRPVAEEEAHVLRFEPASTLALFNSVAERMRLPRPSCCSRAFPVRPGGRGGGAAVPAVVRSGTKVDKDEPRQIRITAGRHLFPARPRPCTEEAHALPGALPFTLPTTNYGFGDAIPKIHPSSARTSAVASSPDGR